MHGSLHAWRYEWRLDFTSDIFSLNFQELAEYEKMSDQVKISDEGVS